jgi:hypothetical protein
LIAGLKAQRLGFIRIKVELQTKLGRYADQHASEPYQWTMSANHRFDKVSIADPGVFGIGGARMHVSQCADHAAL